MAKLSIAYWLNTFKTFYIESRGAWVLQILGIFHKWTNKKDHEKFQKKWIKLIVYTETRLWHKTRLTVPLTKFSVSLSLVESLIMEKNPWRKIQLRISIKALVAISRNKTIKSTAELNWNLSYKKLKLIIHETCPWSLHYLERTDDKKFSRHLSPLVTFTLQNNIWP